MPESLLTILKFCFLALLYLFFARVLRAVWAEMRPPRPVDVHARGATAGQSGTGAKSAKPKMGSARSGPAHRLKVVEPAEQRGRAYDLADELTLGRATGCQVALDDTYVSQLHARLFRQNGELYVEDLGSTNGTYLNRKKVSGPIAVRRGDRLQVGKTVLEVSK